MVKRSDMSQEERTDVLLKNVYKNTTLSVYDFCANEWKPDENVFEQCKAMADELVYEKLARYADDKRTELIITNYGRYWVVKGGFLIYLKEGERKIKAEREKHSEELEEELIEARLKFTHYRITTFWWTFGVSIVGFLLSLINLYLFFSKK